MRSLSRTLTFLLVSLAFALGLNAQQAGIDGSWEGPLQLPTGQTLRVRINIAKVPDGSLKATMDSPDQGASGIPVDEISYADGILSFRLSRLRASYQGKLNAAGEFAGKFTQGMPFDLTLKRLSSLASTAGPRRPQEPQPPFPYSSTDVTFPSKAASVTMAGTLTVPPGEGPFPAVILISGSGPQDRNEVVAGHKIFHVLADHLTRNGVAVLRYDDRGFGKSTGSFTTSTTADFAQDAEGALDYLKTRKEIDAKKIGYAGHSEGGLIAPMVAARRADVAFVVLMAATAVPGADVMIAQGAAINKAMGAPEEASAKNRDLQTKLFAAMREETDSQKLQIRLQQILEQEPALPEAQRLAQVRQLSSPWFRYFTTYDPAPTLAQVKCPVLAINGELDLQVPADQNLPVIEKALKQARNANVAIIRLPSLNHLFQTARTGAPTEYAAIEETMSPKALEAISSWIRKTTGLVAK